MRYSITIRATHWTFLNSTALIGDSNTKGVKFGVGSGTMGRGTPGKRIEAFHVEDVDASSCVAYRNIVLMVGTNNLKQDATHTEADLRNLIALYRRKLEQIRSLNPKCKLFIVPVIPAVPLRTQGKSVSSTTSSATN